MENNESEFKNPALAAVTPEDLESIISGSSSSRSWGTIFMGPFANNELRLETLEKAEQNVWDEKTESEYYERVKTKASEVAQGIITEAQAEAETIRQQAQEAGYAAGVQTADQELNDLRQGMGESVAAVLNAIQENTTTVLNTWREDIVSVLLLAVEKTIGHSLKVDRKRSLAALYLDSLKTLEDKRNLTICVNPEDEDAVSDIIMAAKERTPGLGAWSVKGDPALEAGGLRVETSYGMIDNSIKTRQENVMHIVNQIFIPE